MGLHKVSLLPSTAENDVFREINTLLSHNYYRVYTNFGKVICVIHLIPCSCTDFFAQLDKGWLPNFSLALKTRYACVKSCYYKNNAALQ